MNELDTRRNLRLSPGVLIGGYVDERAGTGAVLVVHNEIVHLNVQQTLTAIAYLTACLQQQKQAS